MTKSVEKWNLECAGGWDGGEVRKEKVTNSPLRWPDFIEMKMMLRFWNGTLATKTGSSKDFLSTFWFYFLNHLHGLR